MISMMYRKKFVPKWVRNMTAIWSTTEIGIPRFHMERGRLTNPPPTHVLKTAKTAALTVRPWLSLASKSTIDPLIEALLPFYAVPFALKNSSVSSLTLLVSVILICSLVSSFSVIVTGYYFTKIFKYVKYLN